ncbi:MAG TPA: 2-phosphosulfolactate phosphatase [Streptosporangiaceae bacterium]|nr:2-phosphosulfolactate phosphatase [Streptosporangiaceae bacterium]
MAELSRRTVVPTWAGQGDYGVSFQWGPVVAPTLTEGVCVVVDVLRFTTAVEAAVSRGVSVYPYRWRDASAEAFAESVHAFLADGGDPAGPSLSPLSMDALAPGASLVLPSPNGSTCAILASEAGAQVVAGCLRNAAAVAAWADEADGPVTVIACGEKWPDGSLRPSLEDLLGAGAILAAMARNPSPEALAAVAAFRDVANRLPEVLSQCASGRELRERGRQADIGYAAELNASATVPVLTQGAFRKRP